MTSLSILYIGFGSGTSLHRARALTRLGHKVTLLDPRTFIPKLKRATDYLIYHTGGVLFQGLVRKRILAALPSAACDLVWVDGGELVGPALVRELKKRYGLVVNYNHDDPFGKRDGWKYKVYLDAIPFYDLVAVVRDCNVAEALAYGARNVLRFYMSADEVAHAPRNISAADKNKWSSEVAFIGTWMPERGPFLTRLIELGVPLSIFGDHWHKAKEWSALQPFWQGPGIYDDERYATAVQSAKVCLGLLSKGNRDLTTTRSFEIPLLGGVLCAERTPEHESLYREGEEAMFWDTPEECAAQCASLLADDDLRTRIATNGRQRCLANHTTHQPTLQKILDNALSLRGQSKAAA